MDQRPVGFFDSGLGGASVLRSALRLLPDENYIYYGDNANAPYGDRSEDDITRLTLTAAKRLVDAGAKTVVIACNTATATCVTALRERLSMPVISVEPAIKPACAAPGRGKVLMLATTATTRLTRYQALKARMPDPARVIDVACPGIADRVEAGIFADDGYDDLLATCLGPYEGLTVDGIVLGCTHYPFIRGAIARYARAHLRGACTFYDGSDATAAHLLDVLTASGLRAGGGSGAVEFLTSGDPARFTPLFRMLLHRTEP